MYSEKACPTRGPQTISEAAREPEISYMLSEIGNLIARCDARAAELRDKLTPVLHQVPLEKNSDKVARSVSSPLAQTLQTAFFQLDEVHSKITRILDTLAV